MNQIARWLGTLVLSVAAVRAGPIYNVSINTAPLIGNPSGPFYVEFQLADGSGTGDGNNLAQMSNFQFGGGSAGGSPIVIGDVTGDMSSTVTLIDSTFVSFFAEPFTPGSNFSFVLSLTTNVDADPPPDAFIFAILDSTLTPIPTTAGQFLDMFLQIDIDSSNPTPQIFASDTERSSIDLGSPTVQSAVPEPGTLGLCSAAAALLAWKRARRVVG